jgi:hypothetical protein
MAMAKMKTIALIKCWQGCGLINLCAGGNEKLCSNLEELFGNFCEVAI